MYPTVEALELFVKPDASRLLTKITRFLTDEGVPAYLVGGFIRDALLGRDTSDIDIAIDADAPDIARQAAATLSGRYVPLDEENGIGRVVFFDADSSRWYIDFSTLRGDIEQDLNRRDFTINAMAIKLEANAGSTFSTDSLIDPLNGREDLHRGIVKAVSDNSFEDDAVRLIRAVRIAAELDFSIDSDTEGLIQRDSQLVANVAGERIREELLRLLALPGAGLRIAYLDKLGVLTAIIPELAPARGIDQPKIHTWDVFEHSLQTISAVEFLLQERKWEHATEDVLSMAPWSTDLKEHFDSEVGSGSTRRSLLKLAALLHDIAKPQTKTIDEEGRARFLGHSQNGATLATEIMERLRFSKKESKLIELLITHHLRPTQMSQEGLPSRRAIYRYFRDTGEAGIDILFLCLADHLATRGPDLDASGWSSHVKTTEYVLKKHREEETMVTPPRLTDGHELMKNLGLNPGPEVGELLEAVREAQAAGEVTTRQQALDYAKSLLTKRNQPRLSKKTRKGK